MDITNRRYPCGSLSAGGETGPPIREWKEGGTRVVGTDFVLECVCIAVKLCQKANLYNQGRPRVVLRRGTARDAPQARSMANRGSPLIIHQPGLYQ